MSHNVQSPKTQISRNQTTQSVVIANGATASGNVDARGYTSFGVVLPAAFTGTSLTFNVASDTVSAVSQSNNSPNPVTGVAGTFQALYDRFGNAVSIPVVAASRSFDLPAELADWPFFQIVSGSAEGAARTLLVVCKG